MRLRLATLNVWGLPFGLAGDLPERLRAIGRRLPGLDVDAIAFQEAWLGATFGALRSAGRLAGLVHAWPESATAPRGGLLVLSRLPIGAARFEAYAAAGLPERVWHGDYLAGKGFAELDLETGDGPLALFVTHMISQYGPDAADLYRGHRMAQVVQLSARVRARPEALVALGDFNLRDDQPHHAALVGLSGLRDVAAALSRREPTVTADNPYRRASRPRPDARLDNVFTRDGGKRSLEPHAIERVFDRPPPGGRGRAYSDHAGLRVELDLTAPGRTASPPESAAVETARRVLLQGTAEADERRGRRRELAGAGLGAGAVALLGARSRRLTRRRLLRGLLGSAGALAGLTGVGAAALAERASPEEAESFAASLRQLEVLESSEPPRATAPHPTPPARARDPEPESGHFA